MQRSSLGVKKMDRIRKTMLRSETRVDDVCNLLAMSEICTQRPRLVLPFSECHKMDVGVAAGRVG